MHQTALLLWLCFQLPRTLALPLGTDTAGLLCSHIASFDSAGMTSSHSAHSTKIHEMTYPLFWLLEAIVHVQVTNGKYGV